MPDRDGTELDSWTVGPRRGLAGGGVGCCARLVSTVVFDGGATARTRAGAKPMLAGSFVTRAAVAVPRDESGSYGSGFGASVGLGRRKDGVDRWPLRRQQRSRPGCKLQR